jgi:hypothetical protein
MGSHPVPYADSIPFLDDRMAQMELVSYWTTACFLHLLSFLDSYKYLAIFDLLHCDLICLTMLRASSHSSCYLVTCLSTPPHAVIFFLILYFPSLQQVRFSRILQASLGYVHAVSPLCFPFLLLIPALLYGPAGAISPIHEHAYCVLCFVESCVMKWYTFSS